MAPYPWLSRFLAPRGCDDKEALRRAVKGKVTLVTGASFGIGEALARRLGAAGARVLLAARSQGELEVVRGEISSAGGQAFAYPVDLSRPEEVDAFAAQIARAHGPVDVVVHNAGKSIRRSLHRSLDRPHDFERCMAVNYLGPVRLQLALLPAMLARGGGQIVSVSSVSVRLPPAAYWAAYSASKSAFDIWMGAAAPELRHARIACTRVYLGLVHTRMSAPTAAYALMPGQTADQAASVVCRAIVSRPRCISPWWLEPMHWISPPLEGLFEWVQSRVLRPAAGDASH
ncbi:MAG: SDR family NAD(P)-dependent oxidoreductase [Armatimonadetes bacterium]|nr:SDR family NAD(P)-dependent oxidoreductase [Armatimonadota bacterium]